MIKSCLYFKKKKSLSIDNKNEWYFIFIIHIRVLNLIYAEYILPNGLENILTTLTLICKVWGNNLVNCTTFYTC